MNKKNKKICIINCYFGVLPSTYELWIESCKYNDDIDFLLVTDQKKDSKVRNVSILNMTLDKFKQLIDKNLSINSNIEKPHKICDYKPMYGIILKEYIRDYEYWGYCDLDMIFGDLRKFIDERILEKYDKIYPLGHLSIYRNEEKVNSRVFEYNDKISFYDILKDKRTLGYDEINGIYNIYLKNKYPMYDEYNFADISHRFKRFKLACSYRRLKNYKHQIFYWKDGKVFRAFIEEKELKYEEFSYIHFQKRNLKSIHNSLDKSRVYLITYDGIIKLDEYEDISKQHIKKYNSYKGKFYELIEEAIFNSKIIIKIIRNKMVKL